MNEMRKYVNLIENAIRLDESFKDAQAKFEKEASSEEVKQYIEKFKELSKRNIISGQDKDISKWIKAGWMPFKEMVDEASNKTTKRDKKKAIKKDAIEIFNNGNVKAIVPLTKEASCAYGNNTKWCTAASEHNMFNQYFKVDNIVLIYVFVGNDKFAIATPNTYNGVFQVFNSQDKIIETSEFELRTGVPATALISKAKEYNEEIMKYSHANKDVGKALSALVVGNINSEQKKTLKKINPVILRDYVYNKPEFAFHYLKEFGKYEDILLKYIIRDPKYALLYARDIVGGKSSKVEKSLRHHPSAFYHYIKEFDPENETWKQVFNNHPKYLYRYSKDIKQDRIDAYLEKIILDDEQYAEKYINNVVIPNDDYAGGKVFEYFILFGTDEQKKKAYRDAIEEIVSGDEILDMFLGLDDSPKKPRDKQDTIARLKLHGYNVDGEFEQFIDEYISRQK